jgi:Uma2 family endonuclease
MAAAMATQSADLLMETEQVVEGRVVRVAERPIPFERFLDMAEGQWLELVDGVIVEKQQPALPLDHERCLGWLYCVAGMYAEKRGLGLMLGSHIMVRADDFGGRMPDLLFVRRERLDIVQQKAVYGAPDLVIEIVSANDRPSDLRALEADYARLGVPELVFIDLRRREIRRLRRGDAGTYQETVFTAGPVAFDSLNGLVLQAEWILDEPRPDEFDTLSALLSV